MAAQPVPQAVLSSTTDPRVRLAMLMGSYMEGGWGPTYNVGDYGTSFGPFQMHEGGALGDLPGNLNQQIAEAQDPNTAISDWALQQYTGAVAQVPSATWQSDPELAAEQAAVIAENPAETYYQQQGTGAVHAAYQASIAQMGLSQPAGQSTPSATSTGWSWSKILQGAGGGLVLPSNPSQGVIQGTTGGIGSVLGSVFGPLERGGLIALGIVAIIVALVVVSHASGASDEVGRGAEAAALA